MYDSIPYIANCMCVRRQKQNTATDMRRLMPVVDKNVKVKRYNILFTQFIEI